MKNNSLIGISGKINSGKDTVASIIQYLTCPYSKNFSFNEWNDRVLNFGSRSMSRYEIKKFADKLKDIVCMLTGCTREQLESQDFKKTVLSEEWNYVSGFEKKHPRKYSKDLAYIAEPERYNKRYSYREIMQLLGTDLLRNQFHEDVWVNSLFADYNSGHRRVRMMNAHDVIDTFDNWIITDMRFKNEFSAVEERNGLKIRIERNTENPSNHISETDLDSKVFDHVIDNNGTLDELIEKVKKVLIQENIL